MSISFFVSSFISAYPSKYESGVINPDNIFVAPFDDIYVMAGQGTIGLEIVEDVKDVQGVLSVVFKSPPADLSKFIKWVAEVRRQEDGSLILSEEEKGRLAVKVCHTFFVFLFWIAIIPHCPFS